MGKPLPTDGIMTPLQMKPLLVKAKEEPVSAAIGLTDKGDGVILLNRTAKPDRMLGLLKTSAAKAKVKLESSSLRFGRAEIDTAEEAGLVKFVVNKEGSDKLRQKLLALVREIPFGKVAIEVDEALENGELPPNDDQPGGDEDHQDEGVDTTLNRHVHALDEMEQVLKRLVALVGSSPGAREVLLEAGRALKLGRMAVAEGSGVGALEQLKLAGAALRRAQEMSNTVDEDVPFAPERQRPRSEQMQHAVTRRLLTSEELMASMDKRPKKNALGGLWTRSKRFKKVLATLKPIDDFMEQKCDTVDEQTFQETQGRLVEAGRKAIAELGVYKIKVDKQYQSLLDQMEGVVDRNKFLPKKRILERRQKFVEAEIKHIETALEKYAGENLSKSWEVITSDPEFEDVKGDMTVGQAIQLKSCGISFSDTNFEDFNDKNLDKENSKESFGKGGINSVSLLQYVDGTQRVFKPIQENRGRSAVATSSGISKDDPHFETRNVSSGFISGLLGMNVVPPCSVSSHNGRAGLMMELASGKSPAYAGEDLVKNFKAEKLHSLNEQLNNLEWCDIVTAQLDRHNKNYIVDVESDPPKVTGIDNDFSFGSLVPSINSMTTMAGYHGFGKPKLIDRKTFDQLMRLDFEQDMLPGLKGRLSEDEIEATRKRFEEAQEHARSLDPKFVVDSWADWRFETEDGKQLTATKYLTAMGGNLLARDFSLATRQLSNMDV